MLFPASETKVKQLREQGIIPYSAVVSGVSVILAVMLAVVVVAPYFLSQWRELVALIVLPSSPISLVFRLIVKLLLWGCVGLSLCMSVVFFVGLLQTHFLVLPIGSCKAEDRSFAGNAMELVGYVAIAVVVLSLGVLAISLYASNPESYNFAITASDLASFASFFKKELILPQQRCLLATVGILIIVAITARIVTVRSFYGRQMMTREELERELKETEMSPEIKQAMRTRIRG